MKGKKLYVVALALTWKSVQIGGSPVKMPEGAPDRWLAAFTSKARAAQWAKTMGYPTDLIEMSMGGAQ